jgi:uncharacterized pyridoxamine 5'-phosphate oxidase family protein
MKKNINFVCFTFLVLSIISCKNKEEELAMLKKIENYEKEEIINMTKDFMYQCDIISYRTKIDLEKVELVLKDYFIVRNGYIFKENSLVIIESTYMDSDEIHNYDLIDNATKKYSMSRDDVIKIYSELESSHQFSDLQFEISELRSTIEDLESKLNP